MHGQDGPGHDASLGQVSDARRFGKPAEDVEDSACAGIALGVLPAQMPVKLDADVEVSAKTVGELRKLSAWPKNLAISTPQDGYPDSAVGVSKVSVAARTSPKSLCGHARLIAQRHVAVRRGIRYRARTSKAHDPVRLRTI